MTFSLSSTSSLLKLPCVAGTESKCYDEEAKPPCNQDLPAIRLFCFVCVYLFTSLSSWLLTAQCSTGYGAIRESFGSVGWSPSRMREWAASRIQGVLQEEILLGRRIQCDRWPIRYTNSYKRSESAGRVRCLDDSVRIQRRTEVAIAVHCDW